MKPFRWLLFFSALFVAQGCYPDDMLARHQQLLVVTTHGWSEVQGELQRYERSDDSSWIPIGESIPVVVGKAGLAWGIGEHPRSNELLPSKIEGDRKSPAGIFLLGSAFGFSPRSEMARVKIEYLQIDENTEAIDDPQSSFYNSIVNNKNVVPDWTSSERMWEIPLYAIGIVINHNFPNPNPGNGSAIFMHIWRRADSGTAGCTAMSRENLEKILCWVERGKNPALIQLPLSSYHQLQKSWYLPELVQIKETSNHELQ